MTSPARSTRTIEERARFGLGYDTNDDSSDPATDQIQLTTEGVVDASGFSLDSVVPTLAFTSADEFWKTFVDSGVDTAEAQSIHVPGLAEGDVIISATKIHTGNNETEFFMEDVTSDVSIEEDESITFASTSFSQVEGLILVYMDLTADEFA